MARTQHAAMNRLTNAQVLESTNERLAELFRASQAVEIDPFRKRRVWVRLMRAPTRGKRPLWLQPALIATLFVSGTAAAAFGHRYAAHSAPAVAASATASARVPETVSAPSEPDTNTNTDTDTDSHNPVSASQAVNTGDSAGGARGRLRSTDDVTHVVEAIQALRLDSDPARAQRLLDDYLKARPHGVLAADALALSIEAASTRHDPRAADYARRYLAQFPQGKYRDLATRALAKH